MGPPLSRSKVPPERVEFLFFFADLNPFQDCRSHPDDPVVDSSWWPPEAISVHMVPKQSDRALIRWNRPLKALVFHSSPLCIHLGSSFSRSRSSGRSVITCVYTLVDGRTRRTPLRRTPQKEDNTAEAALARTGINYGILLSLSLFFYTTNQHTQHEVTFARSRS